MSLRLSSRLPLTLTLCGLVAGTLLLAACATGPATVSPGRDRRRRGCRQRRSRRGAGGERRGVAETGRSRSGTRGGGGGGRRGGRRHAGPAEAVRRRHQGREGNARPVPGLAEGREDLAGDRAGAVRRPLLLFRQPELGHRRELVLRRDDGRKPPRRLPQGRHAGAADRAQHALLRAAEDAAGRGRARGILRQPARERDDRLAAASRAQVGADRGDDAAARRHPGRERRARADLPPILFVRCPQLAHRERAVDAGPHGVQRQRPLCAVAGGPAPGDARIDAVSAAAVDGARRPQPVHRLVLQLRQAARNADGRAGRRRPRRVFRNVALRLHQRQRAVAARQLHRTLAPREEGPRGAAVGTEAADRLLARPQHSGQVSRDSDRRRPRMEQGVRAHRLQGCGAGEDPARRRRLGNGRRAACVDPLDGHRAAGIRRHWPAPGRSADGRDPRRRYRHRPRSPAQPADPAGRARPAADHAIRHAHGGDLPGGRLRRGGVGLCARPARSARRDRARQPGGGAVRARGPEGRRDARGRARARAAPQFPRLDRLHAGAAERPGIHARQWHRGLGDGVQRDQHRAAGREAGLLPDAHARSLRLLGDRVRLQGDPGRRGERRIEAHRRAQHGTAARLFHRRRRLRRHRSRREPGRSRQRPARVRRAPRHAGPRTARALAGPAVEAGRGLLDPAPQRRARAVAGRRVEPRRRPVRGRRDGRARPCRLTATPALPDTAAKAARRPQPARHRRVRFRQLPVQAAVHAAADAGLPRSRRRVRHGPVGARHRLLAAHPGAHHPAQRAEPADERFGRPAHSRRPVEAAQVRAGLPPGRALRRPAPGDLQRAQDRAGHRSLPPQSPARIREQGCHGARAPVGLDARGRAKPVARRGAAAARRDRGGADRRAGTRRKRARISPKCSRRSTKR